MVWSEKLAEMEETVPVRADRGFEQARTRVLQNSGKLAIDHLRDGVSEMPAEVRTLLADRTERAGRTYYAALYGGLIAGCIALLAVAALLILIRRHVAARDMAAAALNSTEQRFRQLADAMPKIVWAADPDGAADYYNARWYEYSGAPSGQSGADAWGRAMHPDDAERCNSTYAAAVSLATLAHELRNPLAPICNAVSFIEVSAVKAAAFERVHDIIERQLDQMVRLIDDLLDVSRINRGKLELRLERLELADALHQASEACRPAFEAHNQEFVLKVSQESIQIEAQGLNCDAQAARAPSGATDPIPCHLL